MGSLFFLSHAKKDNSRKREKKKGNGFIALNNFVNDCEF